ncbi:unnamed protein product, partial [Symbiodinium necroappetens]
VQLGQEGGLRHLLMARRLHVHGPVALQRHQRLRPLHGPGRPRVPGNVAWRGHPRMRSLLLARRAD